MEGNFWSMGTYAPYMQKKLVIQKKLKKFQIFFGIKHDQVLQSYKKIRQRITSIASWVEDLAKNAIYKYYTRYIVVINLSFLP